MLNPMSPLPGWQGGDANAAYLDKTLRHGPMELYFDESVHPVTIRLLWLRSFVSAFAAFLLFGLFGIFGGFAMTVLGLLASVAAFWLVFLLSRLDEPVGEWRVVLTDRAPAEMSVYSAIRGRLRERQLPIASVQTRRCATGFGAVSNRLVLIDGHYRVYVSVFAYGSSLYLGWMMWRSRRGHALVLQFVADLIAGLTGRLDTIGLMLRTERPRAMREAAHALCREGLHVAIEQIEVPTSYGFPNGLPPVEPLPGTHLPPATGDRPGDDGGPGAFGGGRSGAGGGGAHSATETRPSQQPVRTPNRTVSRHQAHTR